VRACFELWSAVAIGFALLAGSLRAEFAYVASADGNISAYRIGEEGTLTPVAGSPFPAGNDPVSIVAAPLGQFRLRGKRDKQQHLGIRHRQKRDPDAGPRINLRSGDPSQGTDQFLWRLTSGAGSSTRQTGTTATSRPLVSVQTGL
jgi:hypothetical protein